VVDVVPGFGDEARTSSADSRGSSAEISLTESPCARRPTTVATGCECHEYTVAIHDAVTGDNARLGHWGRAGPERESLLLPGTAVHEVL